MRDRVNHPRDARRLLHCTQDRMAVSLPHKCAPVRAPSRHPALMKSLALCARSPSTLMATTPLAAQRQEIASPATTPSATWLQTLQIRACSRQCSRSKAFLGSSRLGRRPGDVTVQNWCDGKGLAIDVAVTSPFSAQHPANKPPCECYAEQYKHRKYEKDFKGSDYLFSAIVWETTGAVNAEGEEVLRNLMRFASKRLGREHSSFCGRQWARLSICLQRERLPR